MNNKQRLRQSSTQINVSNYRRVHSRDCAGHWTAERIRSKLLSILGMDANLVTVLVEPGAFIQVNYKQGTTGGKWVVPGYNTPVNLRTVVSDVVSELVSLALVSEAHVLVEWQTDDRIGATCYVRK